MWGKNEGEPYWTGEDKPDDTKVYAGLNRMAPYRAAELAWFREHVETTGRVAEARGLAYEAASHIHFGGIHYRRDVADS